MKVFEAESYQDFVRNCLEDGTPHQPKATKKSLAEHLKCHSTYISHVLADKAHFSNEQAVRFCDFFVLTDEETDAFLDLLGRDRAGDVATRRHFERRLARRREEWLSVSERLREENRLTKEQEARYFESWMFQAVHLSCMLTGADTAGEISRRLGIQEGAAAKVLATLEEMGLVEREEGRLKLRNRRLHLDKASPAFRNYHAGWRLKTLADVRAKDVLDGIHYTSILTVSKETVDEIRKLVLDHIEASRALAVSSSPEEIYLYALDFYPLTES